MVHYKLWLTSAPSYLSILPFENHSVFHYIIICDDLSQRNKQLNCLESNWVDLWSFWSILWGSLQQKPLVWYCSRKNVFVTHFWTFYIFIEVLWSQFKKERSCQFTCNHTFPLFLLCLYFLLAEHIVFVYSFQNIALNKLPHNTRYGSTASMPNIYTYSYARHVLRYHGTFPGMSCISYFCVFHHTPISTSAFMWLLWDVVVSRAGARCVSSCIVMVAV